MSGVVLQKAVLKWIDHDDAPTNQSNHSIDDVDLDDDADFQKLARRHARIALDEVARKHGVPQSELMKYLEQESEREDSCQSLPFTLLLVASYTLMAITHDQAPKVAAVEDSISFDIIDNANFAFQDDVGYKDMPDVNSHADFWSWMARGFVPLLWSQEYSYGHEMAGQEPYASQATEVFARKDRGQYLSNNRIVLGVRMVQERAPVVDDNNEPLGECKFKPLRQVYGKRCVGGAGPYRLEPEVVMGRKTVGPRREHWLYIHDDVGDVLRQVERMEKDGWLDANTLKVELTIPIHNAEYGLHSVIMCNFFFSRGGHIWKAIIPMTAWTQTFKYWWNFVIDFTWLFCLAWIILTEGLEISFVIKEHGAKGIFTYYIGFWNGVDWISVFSGLGILGMLYFNENYTTKMNYELEQLGKINEATSRSEYREQGKIYFNALEVQAHYSYSFRVTMASYPLVIAMRLFKAFGSQPRLAIITNTLMAASIDLVHFLLIFVSVFITYTVAGVVLFGRESNTFTTMFRAVITSARLAVGDFDWEELRQVGRSDAFLWLVPFVVLIVWLLLNMLIAIVMDGYNEVKASMEGEDTIWQMCKKLYRTKRQMLRGEVVPWHKLASKVQQLAHAEEEKAIQDALEREIEAGPSKTLLSRSMTGKVKALLGQEEDDLGPIMTVQKMKEVFPNGELSTAQASQVIQGAIMTYYNNNKERADVDEVMTLINKISYSTKKLKEKVKNRVNAKGLAKNNPGEVATVADEMIAEINAARTDLAEWIPEDADDCPLSDEWLVSRMEAPKHDAGVLDNSNDSRASEARRHANPMTLTADTNGGPVRQGLLTSVRTMVKSGDARVQTLVPGGQAQLLADEHLVLSACRAAGISPKYDALRRMALGKVMRVMKRDESDGTVLCKLDGVGDVWFAVSAFAPTMNKGTTAADESSKETPGGSHENERRYKELEQELQVGKETVSLGIQTLNELNARLENIRNTKRRGIEKFQEKRREAVLLSRENRERRTRWQEGQTRLKTVTQKRDEYFERVKTLVEENRDLERKLAHDRIHDRR